MKIAFTALIAILMTGVLLLGLPRRERHAPAGIGFVRCLVLILEIFPVIHPIT